MKLLSTTKVTQQLTVDSEGCQTSSHCTIVDRNLERCTRFWWGNLRERDHWGDQDVDGRIMLRWILRKWEGVVGTVWSWFRIGTGGGRL